MLNCEDGRWWNWMGDSVTKVNWFALRLTEWLTGFEVAAGCAVFREEIKWQVAVWPNGWLTKRFPGVLLTCRCVPNYCNLAWLVGICPDNWAKRFGTVHHACVSLTDQLKIMLGSLIMRFQYFGQLNLSGSQWALICRRAAAVISTKWMSATYFLEKWHCTTCKDVCWWDCPLYGFCRWKHMKNDVSVHNRCQVHFFVLFILWG